MIIKYEYSTGLIFNWIKQLNKNGKTRKGNTQYPNIANRVAILGC